MEDSTWCFSMFLVWKIESWFAKAKAHTPNRKSEQPIQITCSESMWLYLSVNISVLISKLCILEFREPSWYSLRKLLMCGHHFFVLSMFPPGWCCVTWWCTVAKAFIKWTAFFCHSFGTAWLKWWHFKYRSTYCPRDPMLWTTCETIYMMMW